MGAPLTLIGNPIQLTVGAIVNAQLRLGAYPGGNWNTLEMMWRVTSLLVAMSPIVNPGPRIPAQAPGAGVAAFNPAQLQPPGMNPAGYARPSPVATSVDATERAQLGYHVGTALGGALAPVLYAGPNGRWFAYHLTRAQRRGGVFNFLTAQRPDVVLFAVNTANNTFNHFVVWENKGHTTGALGQAPLGPALLQARSLASMSALPSNPVVNYNPARAPAAYVASMVDVVVNNNASVFRLQTRDPPGPPEPPTRIPPAAIDGFLRGYYEPFVDVVERGTDRRDSTHEGRTFTSVLLNHDVRLGVPRDILEAIKQSLPAGELTRRVDGVLSAGFKNPKPDLAYADSTGILVELPPDWLGARHPGGPPDPGDSLRGAAPPPQATTSPTPTVAPPTTARRSEGDGTADVDALLESCHPADLFDAVAGARAPSLSRWVAEHFEIIAMPGESARERLRPGDVVVQRALGEARLGWTRRLGEGETVDVPSNDRILLRYRGGGFESSRWS